MPEPSRLSLPLLLVGFLLASPAAGDVQTLEVEGVRCTAGYSWPDTLGHGYFPVRVELVNPTDGDVELAIEATQSWGQEDRVAKNVAVRAGERLEFELLLRARAGGQNQYTLAFATDDEESGIGGRGPREYSGGDEQAVMFFSRGRVDESTVKDWASVWSGGTHRHGDVSIGAATLEEMSPSWDAYSSLDSVILDLEGGWPGAGQLEAVVAWARSGGRLIFVGADPMSRLAGVPSVACWLEERFETPLGSPSGPNDDGISVFHAGTGFLVLVSCPGEAASAMESIRTDHRSGLAFQAHSLELTPAWVPAARDSRADRAMALLPGFGNLPLRSLMLLLVLFALVMGPVNFLWVRRMKKPMMLLVTVPGIAIVTSLGLIAYGLFSQGLDVKSVTRTWSVLDQRTNHATTVEVRRLFAGSSPGVGLRPERGTAIFPEARFWRGSYGQSHLFTQDLNGGRLFAGDYLQIRQPMGQLLVSDRAARVRLEARYVGEEVEVSNGLGTAVRELFLRAPDGEYHELRGGLEPGAGARLVPTAETARRMVWNDDLTWVWGETRPRLAPGTYIAWLENAALQDDCGVPANEIEGRHVVLGILDGDEGAWR